MFYCDTFETGKIKQNIQLNKRQRNRKFKLFQYFFMKFSLTNFWSMFSFYTPENMRKQMVF